MANKGPQCQEEGGGGGIKGETQQGAVLAEAKVFTRVRSNRRPQHTPNGNHKHARARWNSNGARIESFWEPGTSPPFPSSLSDFCFARKELAGIRETVENDSTRASSCNGTIPWSSPATRKRTSDQATPPPTLTTFFGQNQAPSTRDDQNGKHLVLNFIYFPFNHLPSVTGLRFNRSKYARLGAVNVRVSGVY